MQAAARPGTPVNGLSKKPGQAKGDRPFWLGAGISIYLENNSKKSILVQARDSSVNGLMINAIFSCQVSAGKRAFDTLTFFDSDLEENGITEIEDIELYFTVSNSKNNDTIFESDVVKISFVE